MRHSKRKTGFFVAFDYSSAAMTKVSTFFKQSGKVIIPLPAHSTKR
jgi:hypothetical protein